MKLESERVSDLASRKRTEASEGIGPPCAPADEFSFGGLRLVASNRVLEKDGRPIALGARAFDILHALASGAPEVVDRQSLIAAAWPHATVGETSLRHHIAELRRAVRGAGVRGDLILTVAGRGYVLSQTVRRPTPAAPVSPRGAATFTWSLPTAPRIIGRSDASLAVAEALSVTRFVSIVGPPGIGKTTLAIAVGHDLASSFRDGVAFIDATAVLSAAQLVERVALGLGLKSPAPGPVEEILPAICGRQMLLVFDGCEHLIEPIASLLERLFQASETVAILVTSRETLRVEGEQVYRLKPLASPPLDAGEGAWLSYPAAELFVERVAASGYVLAPSQANAQLVSAICRKLDGIALALELVASRVGVFGLRQTAELLDARFHLLWPNRRLASPRHQTLDAALGWSYDLLSVGEKQTLRRLSVFMGWFHLASAQAVAGAKDLDEASARAAVAALVSKSLLQVRNAGGEASYRLLDTTRVFARLRLEETGELAVTALRHAAHFAATLSKSEAGQGQFTTAEATDMVADVRAGLAWCFENPDGAEVGVLLAARSAKLFVTLARLKEACAWIERAIACFDGGLRDPQTEMDLLAFYGFAGGADGDNRPGRAALERGLALAERLGDTVRCFQFLAGLNSLLHCMGDLRGSIRYARRARDLASAVPDPDARAIALAMLGFGQHLVGNHRRARVSLKEALGRPAARRLGPLDLGYDRRSRALAAHARSLWIAGQPEAAGEAAKYAIQDSVRLHHPISACLALMWCTPVLLWCDAVEAARDAIDRFAFETADPGLAYFRNIAMGLEGRLALREGRFEAGVEQLGRALEPLLRNDQKPAVTDFLGALAEGYLGLGRLTEARTTIEQALAHARRCGDLALAPELLRIKAVILAPVDETASDVAFMRALDLARRQDAVGWELRTAVSFAARLAPRPHGPIHVRALLEPICARFSPRTRSTDLALAAEMLGVDPIASPVRLRA